MLLLVQKGPNQSTELILTRKFSCRQGRPKNSTTYIDAGHITILCLTLKLVVHSTK
jgi:hypothetical protein